MEVLFSQAAAFRRAIQVRPLCPLELLWVRSRGRRHILQLLRRFYASRRPRPGPQTVRASIWSSWLAGKCDRCAWGHGMVTRWYNFTKALHLSIAYPFVRIMSESQTINEATTNIQYAQQQQSWVIQSLIILQNWPTRCKDSSIWSTASVRDYLPSIESDNNWFLDVLVFGQQLVRMPWKHREF